MLFRSIGVLALTLTVPITTVIAAYTVPTTSNKNDTTTDEGADSEAAEDTASTTA